MQVLFLAMGEAPLGRRANWPLFAACERHGLAVGIHAGSTYRHAPTYAGWPSYRVEDYVAQSGAFETQLLSLIAEGVFQKFTGLKVVLMEFGLDLAAALPVAGEQDLARHAPRGAVDRPAARGDRARPRAFHAAAGGRAEG